MFIRRGDIVACNFCNFPCVIFSCRHIEVRKQWVVIANNDSTVQVKRSSLRCTGASSFVRMPPERVAIILGSDRDCVGVSGVANNARQFPAANVSITVGVQKYVGCRVKT